MIVDDPLTLLEFLGFMAPKLIIGAVLLTLLAFILYQVVYRAVRRAIRDALGISKQPPTSPAGEGSASTKNGTKASK